MSVLRIILFMFTAALFSFDCSAQNLSSFLQRLESLAETDRLSPADSFRLHNPGFPVYEYDTTVWFFDFSESARVAIAGDPTNWAPTLEMKHIQGTKLWYHKACFPANARFEYKIVRNGKDYVLDSLNPITATGGFGTNSEIRMPRYSPALETVNISTVPEGSLQDTAFYSREMKEQRRVTIYLPAAYSGSDQRYPVVFFNDGPDYLNFANIKPVLDRMAAGPASLQVIAVFIHPVKRDAECSGKLHDAYSRYVAKELFPFIDRTFRILPGPENHAIAGISNGGNAALWIAVSNPDEFGRVAAHSSNVEKYVSSRYEKQPELSLRVYIDIGTYDMAMLIPMYQNLRSVLQTKGYTCLAPQFPEGHNWGFWRNQTAAALRFLFQ